MGKVYKLEVPTMVGQADAELTPMHRKREALESITSVLVHSSQCTDVRCRVDKCVKLKKLLSHMRICKKKGTGGCVICKQLSIFLVYHAKVLCKDSGCRLLYCAHIKSKLQEKTMLHSQHKV